MYSEDLTVDQYVKEFEQKPWLIPTVSPARAIGMVADEEMHGFLCGEESAENIATITVRWTAFDEDNYELEGWRKYSRGYLPEWFFQSELKATYELMRRTNFPSEWTKQKSRKESYCQLREDERTSESDENAKPRKPALGTKDRGAFLNVQETQALGDLELSSGLYLWFFLHCFLTLRPLENKPGPNSNRSGEFFDAIYRLLIVTFQVEKAEEQSSKDLIEIRQALSSPITFEGQKIGDLYERFYSSLPTDLKMNDVVKKLVDKDAFRNAWALAYLIIDPARLLQLLRLRRCDSKSSDQITHVIWNHLHDRIDSARRMLAKSYPTQKGVAAKPAFSWFVVTPVNHERAAPFTRRRAPSVNGVRLGRLENFAKKMKLELSPLAKTAVHVNCA